MAIQAEWVGAGLTAAVVLGTAAFNLFVMGRFVGSWSENARRFADVVGKLEKRIEDLEEGEGVAREDRATIAQRLGQAEEAAKVLWKVRDDFVRASATAEAENRHSRERLDSVARGVAQIERQFANLLQTRVGLTTLTDREPPA